jgi:hypothetical protein
LKAGGLDAVLLFLERYDHMWVGIHLPESPKEARSQTYFYRYEGKKYYVAETTGGNWEIGWRVGECPDILKSAAARVIPLSNYERSSPGQVSSSYTIPDSSALDMSLSTNLTIFQSNVEISGLLSPSLAGKNVTLYTNSFDTPSVVLATVVTNSDGYYSYTWESPPGGIYSIRANWSGDEDYHAADSRTFKLVVVPVELLLIGVTLVIFVASLIIVSLGTRKKIIKSGKIRRLGFCRLPSRFFFKKISNITKAQNTVTLELSKSDTRN